LLEKIWRKVTLPKMNLPWTTERRLARSSHYCRDHDYLGLAHHVGVAPAVEPEKATPAL
jgi:hypothetical protein